MTDEGSVTPLYEWLDPERPVEGDGPAYEGWVLTVDPDAIERPVDEHRLVLAPATGGDHFSVLKCDEPFPLSADAALCRPADHITVEVGAYRYKLLQCVFLAPDQVDQVSGQQLLSVPPEMADRTVPATGVRDEPLWEVLVEGVGRAQPVSRA